MRNKEGLNWEVSVGVTFASFMSAVTLFFTGIVISQYGTFDQTIKIPLLFLIISTFSFIFSASIYSNAGIEITRSKFEEVKKFLIYANNVFEFFGLYLLIIATPLVIGTVTPDSFLRISTIAVSLTGITLYSRSTFSILHKEVINLYLKSLVTAVITGLSGLLFVAQYQGRFAWLNYNLIATLLLLTLALLTIFSCRNSKQYTEY